MLTYQKIDQSCSKKDCQLKKDMASIQKDVCSRYMNIYKYVSLDFRFPKKPLCHLLGETLRIHSSSDLDV